MTEERKILGIPETPGFISYQTEEQRLVQDIEEEMKNTRDLVMFNDLINMSADEGLGVDIEGSVPSWFRLEDTQSEAARAAHKLHTGEDLPPKYKAVEWIDEETGAVEVPKAKKVELPEGLVEGSAEWIAARKLESKDKPDPQLADSLTMKQQYYAPHRVNMEERGGLPDMMGGELGGVMGEAAKRQPYVHYDPALNDAIRWVSESNISEDDRQTAIADLQAKDKGSDYYKQYADSQWKDVRGAFEITGEPAVRAAFMDPTTVQGFTKNFVDPTAMGLFAGADYMQLAGLGRRMLGTLQEGTQYEAEKILRERGIIKSAADRIEDVASEQPLTQGVGAATSLLSPYGLGSAAFKGISKFLPSAAGLPIFQGMARAGSEGMLTHAGVDAANKTVDAVADAVDGKDIDARQAAEDLAVGSLISGATGGMLHGVLGAAGRVYRRRFADPTALPTGQTKGGSRHDLLQAQDVARQQEFFPQGPGAAARSAAPATGRTPSPEMGRVYQAPGRAPEPGLPALPPPTSAGLATIDAPSTAMARSFTTDVEKALAGDMVEKAVAPKTVGVKTATGEAPSHLDPELLGAEAKNLLAYKVQKAKDLVRGPRFAHVPGYDELTALKEAGGKAVGKKLPTGQAIRDTGTDPITESADTFSKEAARVLDNEREIVLSLIDKDMKAVHRSNAGIKRDVTEVYNIVKEARDKGTYKGHALPWGEGDQAALGKALERFEAMMEPTGVDIMNDLTGEWGVVESLVVDSKTLAQLSHQLDRTLKGFVKKQGVPFPGAREMQRALKKGYDKFDGMKEAMDSTHSRLSKIERAYAEAGVPGIEALDDPVALQRLSDAAQNTKSRKEFLSLIADDPEALSAFSKLKGTQAKVGMRGGGATRAVAKGGEGDMLPPKIRFFTPVSEAFEAVTDVFFGPMEMMLPASAKMATAAVGTAHENLERNVSKRISDEVKSGLIKAQRHSEEE
ncbi:MAG: hypothetical protein ACYTBJ_16375 [Planctomycetota bacterium]|jgi:hypothetical protein